MSVFLLALAGYMIGSVPFSFIVARRFGVKDVRAVGSGNVGATNVMRSAGRFPGALALILDASKGALAVVIARRLGAADGGVCIAGLCAVIGHLFPVWLGFRGGKGVATGAGLFIPLAPGALGAGVVAFVITLAASRLVSLASIAACVALPSAVLLSSAAPAVKTTAVIAGAIVIAKHHANIARLARGQEPRIGAHA